jgi:dethiobiotin synthetase
MLQKKLNLPPYVFVTGTDTDIGKTFICALLALGLQAGYWKPIQSGSREGNDTDWIKKATLLPDSHFFPENYCLTEPLSPHAAAAIDGVEIDLSTIRLPEKGRLSHLFIEGAGGLMVPLNKRHLVADLIKHLKLPVLVVAKSGLGTINHSLLTLEQLRRQEIPILGMILNGPKNPVSKQAIQEYGNVEVIAEVERLEKISPTTLKQTFDNLF